MESSWSICWDEFRAARPRERMPSLPMTLNMFVQKKSVMQDRVADDPTRRDSPL